MHGIAPFIEPYLNQIEKCTEKYGEVFPLGE
jgi:hypothetical protein